MYSVVGPDGNIYGPADIPTLIQWRNEGRLTAETVLVDETGNRFPASTVPALFPPQQPGMPGQPMPGQPMGMAQPNPYSAAPSNYPRDYSGYNDEESKKLVTRAYIYGALALLCCPILFGWLGWQAATKAEEMGNSNGTTAKWVVLALSLTSLVLGAVGNLATRR